MTRLEEFLEQKEVLEIFKENLEATFDDVEKRANDDENHESWKNFLENYGNYSEAINLAFYWTLTDQGHTFWETLQDEFALTF